MGAANIAAVESPGEKIIVAAMAAENHDPVVIGPPADTVADNSSSPGGCRPSSHRTEALKRSLRSFFSIAWIDSYFFAGAGDGDEDSLAAGFACESF